MKFLLLVEQKKISKDSDISASKVYIENLIFTSKKV